MRAYTKHTDGEAYTLNGSNYVGFFHIDDDGPKTGEYQTIESLVLTPRQTFISSLFDKKHQTDTTFKSISGLTPYYSNVFDILNRPGLEHAFGNVDINNLIVFKNLILGHPTIYQYDENNGFFYGLSAANLDILNGKNGYMDIVPFSKDNYWSFMDNIICGSFVINSNEEFKYLCSTGTNNYVLSGSFLNKNTVLTKLSEYDQHPYATQTPEYTHHIHNDVTNNKILYVNDNFINVYDSSNYDECNNLILIDKLPLKLCETNEYIWNRTTSKWKDFADKWSTRFNTKNPNNPKFIKFGKNIRTSIDGKILSIINKYSSDVYQKIDLSRWVNGSCVSLDVREIDDNIIILHRDVQNLYILMIDPKNLDISSNTQVYSIITSFDKYVIKFSEFDSNVFFLSNLKEYQTRYISNPKYPAGRLEACDLEYQNSFIWNKVDQKWGAMRWRWKSEASSNNYNNLLASQLVKNNKMYMILHNIGRLYVIKQPLHDRFLSAIPLDTEKFYNGINCSESSLGLYFNTAISNLVKDTLNLFNQSLGSFSIYERKVITKQLNDFVLKTDNLYINGNETINVIALQRIFILLTEIQSKLLPVTVEI
jgi:hypothetical protein